VDAGAYPSLLGFRGFPKSTCISVNDVMTNGMPSARELQDGDVVGVSTGIYLRGVYAKLVRSYAVGPLDDDRAMLLEQTRIALDRAIGVIRPGREVNVIGRVIESWARRHGLGVVRGFTGHGIGIDPFTGLTILNYDEPDVRTVLEPGMTFTVHPILTLGGIDYDIDDDGWTVTTRDGSCAAEFAHTVVVTADGVDILSRL
jgi:methionyl aminopeptidase